MRFKLIFELENPIIPVQYRKSIISYMKNALHEYDELLFSQLYGSNTKKSFCFATGLPNPKFSKEKIELSSNSFEVIFSIYNYAYALHIYNSILKQKFKKFSINQNSMTLRKIIMIKERKIETDNIKIKLYSPMIVRNHNRETLKDMYYSFEREEFKQYLKINILEQMKAEGLDSSLLNGFDIIPVNAKKTVLPVYEKMIECSIGEFGLIGDSRLLNYLYKARNRIKEGHGIRII